MAKLVYLIFIMIFYAVLWLLGTAFSIISFFGSLLFLIVSAPVVLIVTFFMCLGGPKRRRKSQS